MGKNEEKKDAGLPAEQDRQIQLIVNQPDDDDDEIDMGNVFYNMNKRSRFFTCVLVLCLTLGFSIPLLIYQFTKPDLTVSSVVTLQYEVPQKVLRNEEEVIPDNPEYAMVTDLTAPDGEPLDPNQITSAYVLQTALDGIELSQPITAANLRANIGIQTMLTEDSQRLKESLAGLAELKNAGAYTQLQDAEMEYKNSFVVTLKNGFGDEDSRVKLELKSAELSQVLDRVLSVYNDYLVRNYADIRLPEDKLSVIDIQSLDIMDSLDEMRAGIEDLEKYCNEKSETVQNYRSWKTGRSLTDWEETLETFKNIDVDYLYTMVSEKAITRDKAALLMSYKYMLRNAQNELQKVNEDIEETKTILANYKNDDIFVSMQESDGAKSTKAATDYYNDLMLQQTENFEKAAELEVTIADYTNRILRLEATTQTEVTDEVEEELERSMSTAQSLYDDVASHMEELFDSALYTSYARHTTPQGKMKNFLVASQKKIIIGVAIGAVLALGLWFLAGLAPEFHREHKEEDDRKGAGRK